jgi:hypothetical protein
MRSDRPVPQRWADDGHQRHGETQPGEEQPRPEQDGLTAGLVHGDAQRVAQCLERLALRLRAVVVGLDGVLDALAQLGPYSWRVRPGIRPVAAWT